MSSCYKVLYFLRLFLMTIFWKTKGRIRESEQCCPSNLWIYSGLLGYMNNKKNGFVTMPYLSPTVSFNYINSMILAIYLGTFLYILRYTFSQSFLEICVLIFLEFLLIKAVSTVLPATAPERRSQFCTTWSGSCWRAGRSATVSGSPGTARIQPARHRSLHLQYICSTFIIKLAHVKKWHTGAVANYRY